MIGKFARKRIQPFWIEDEARQIEGTNFIVDQQFREFAVRDGLLVTGQQQFSGAADAVFLAIPFGANEGALTPVKELLAGKILVDCTNPVGRGFTHGLASTHSGAEHVQKLVPSAKVVKAFNIYGAENFENNHYPGYEVKPAMLYCGNHQDAKKTVGDLIAQLGWEPVDVGALEQALHLEHMTLLWVRMVRAGGHSPNLVWAALRR